MPSIEITLDLHMKWLVEKQEGHDGPEIAHLSLLIKRNSFPISSEITVKRNILTNTH